MHILIIIVVIVLIFFIPIPLSFHLYISKDKFYIKFYSLNLLSNEDISTRFSFSSFSKFFFKFPLCTIS